MTDMIYSHFRQAVHDRRRVTISDVSRDRPGVTLIRVNIARILSLRPESQRDMLSKPATMRAVVCGFTGSSLISQSATKS